MDHVVDELLEVLRLRLSERDIRDFAPSDPGYAGYVCDWTAILKSGIVPTKCHFNLSEVIGLSGWSRATDFAEPNRFRTFRLLTNCVAVRLYLAGNDCESVRPLNYVAIRLIDDARDLNDNDVVCHVGNVLSETARLLKDRAWLEEEYPFLFAGEMVWAQRTGDLDRADVAAKNLLAEEQAVRRHPEFYGEDSRFLFGLTIYDQLNADWHRAFAGLANPNNCEEMELVIDTLIHPAQHRKTS